MVSFDELPIDILYKISKYLEFSEVKKMMSLNKTLNRDKIKFMRKKIINGKKIINDLIISNNDIKIRLWAINFINNMRRIEIKNMDDLYRIYLDSNTIRNLKITHLNVDELNESDIDKLPKTIECLNIGRCKCELMNIPKSVELLIIGNNTEIVNYPENIKILNISINLKLINQLPKTLKKLYLRTYDCGIDDDYIIESLPDNLEEIDFGMYFDSKILKYPTKLKRIYFGRNFNKSIDNLPEQVEEIYLGKYFEQPINKLPKSLKKIRIYEYQRDLINEINNNVKISYYNN